MLTDQEPTTPTPQRKPPLRSLAATQQQAAQRLAQLATAQRAASEPTDDYTEFLDKRLDAMATAEAAAAARQLAERTITVATPAPARRIQPAEREAALEAYFYKRVRLMGGMAVKVAPTQKGVPDRLVLLPGGRIALVELKTTTGRLSPAQQLWHSRAAALGVQVAVLAGRDAVDGWVRAQFPKDIPAREARALAAAAHPRAKSTRTAAAR